VSTLLVVDDVEAARTSLRRKLGKSRQVRCASSGAEALDVLAGERVDFAVVDVHMPVMNGVELLLAIRGQWPHVPVVLLSGLWSPRMMRAGLLAGALDCIDKSAECLDTLERMIERAEIGEPPVVDVGPFEIPTVDQITDEFYLGVVDVYGGNITRAAEAVRIHRTSLQRSVKRAREREGPR
jgi:DNA-binding NtrC family response regulator